MILIMRNFKTIGYSSIVIATHAIQSLCLEERCLLKCLKWVSTNYLNNSFTTTILYLLVQMKKALGTKPWTWNLTDVGMLSIATHKWFSSLEALKSLSVFRKMTCLIWTLYILHLSKELFPKLKRKKRYHSHSSYLIPISIQRWVF